MKYSHSVWVIYSAVYTYRIIMELVQGKMHFLLSLFFGSFRFVFVYTYIKILCTSNSVAFVLIKITHALLFTSMCQNISADKLAQTFASSSQADLYISFPRGMTIKKNGMELLKTHVKQRLQVMRCEADFKMLNLMQLLSSWLLILKLAPI